MATMNSNQENLYQEVLKVLQARTNDPSVIMTALGRAMLIILQAAQIFCESYKQNKRKPVRSQQKAPDGLHKSNAINQSKQSLYYEHREI